MMAEIVKSLDEARAKGLAEVKPQTDIGKIISDIKEIISSIKELRGLQNQNQNQLSSSAVPQPIPAPANPVPIKMKEEPEQKKTPIAILKIDDEQLNSLFDVDIERTLKMFHINPDMTIGELAKKWGFLRKAIKPEVEKAIRKIAKPEIEWR